ncbi:MAG: Glu-tRNA(Gln) amidotransferase subunit GatD, partial [Candidatus Bathyarchaeia archaeon]
VKPAFAPPPPPKAKPGLPTVAIVSTGGTIASRVDYRTGAVYPALSARDLYSVVPELSEIASIRVEILFSLFSENIHAPHWSEMAKTAARHIEGGVDGVVLCHGTDTMGYTAAALSFALQNLPVPVVIVGSQRSSDRPSSDAAMNLTNAVFAATRGPFAEVALGMHETVSDKATVLHRGTKVRKCHTSRRDTFRSVNASPIARVEAGGVTMLVDDYRMRDRGRGLVLRPSFEERVGLVKFHPGLNPSIIQWYIDEGYYGIVLEGTGLGHVGKALYDPLKRAMEEDLLVGMTSQCLWGRVNMNVYDTGMDLQAMGVIPLGDMLPETALVKMMWVLGQTKDLERARKLFLTNIAYEFSSKTPYKQEWTWP